MITFSSVGPHLAEVKLLLESPNPNSLFDGIPAESVDNIVAPYTGKRNTNHPLIAGYQCLAAFVYKRHEMYDLAAEQFEATAVFLRHWNRHDLWSNALEYLCQCLDRAGEEDRAANLRQFFPQFADAMAHYKSSRRRGNYRAALVHLDKAMSMLHPDSFEFNELQAKRDSLLPNLDDHFSRKAASLSTEDQERMRMDRINGYGQNNGK
ncbi:MAG: hypothetical protein V1740_01675 [Candidatus Woesearchaeota archaeon]